MTRLLNRVLTREEFREMSGKPKRPGKPRSLVEMWSDKDLLGTRVELWLPLEIESEANSREHWRKKHARASDQQDWIEAWSGLFRHVRLPTDVALARIAPRQLDSDNLASGFKAVRDAIARTYGRDDADWRKDSVRWHYMQEQQGKKYGVRIVVRGKLI